MPKNDTVKRINQVHTDRAAGGAILGITSVTGGSTHDPVTLDPGCAPELTLSVQKLSLAAVLTPTEHTAIGDSSPHHAAVTLASPNHGLGLSGQVLTLGTPSAVTVSSANGVTTTTHTHAVTSSANPGAAASLLASDASGYLTLVKLNTDTIADKSGANLTLSPAGDVIFDPTGNDLLPATNYDLNLGAINKKYLTLHAAELWVETLVAQDTIATIGGRILVGPTTTLTVDRAAEDTTFVFKHNEIAIGDRIYMEADGKIEFMAVTAGPVGAGPYQYAVTRDLDGTGANAWYAGDAVFNTGTTGDGFIDIYSLRSVKSATQYGPAIVGNIRNSATYNDWSEHWAIGNLNGVYGYGVTTYGAAFGKYGGTTTDYLTVDATNGIRFMNYNSGSPTVQGSLSAKVWTLGATSGNHVQVTTSEVLFKTGATELGKVTGTSFLFGLNTGTNPNLVFDTTNGLRLRHGTTAVITFDTSGNAEITRVLKLPQTTSALAIGATPPTSASAGTGLWLDRTGMYALTADAAQVVVNASGVRVAKDSTGLRFVASATITTDTAASDGRMYYKSGDTALAIESPGGYLNIDVGTAGFRANIGGSYPFWKFMSKGTSAPGDAHTNIQLAFGTIANNYVILEQVAQASMMNLYLGSGASPQNAFSFIRQYTAPTYIPRFRVVSLKVAASGGTGYIGVEEFSTAIDYAWFSLIGWKDSDKSGAVWCTGGLSKPGSSYTAIYFTNNNDKVSETSGSHFVFLNSSGQLAIRNNSGDIFQYQGLCVTSNK
jgi:hypothetical protein